MADTFEGRTFDWISRHDPRSLAFPARAQIRGVPKRKKVLWKPGDVCLDQGAEGSCFGGDVLIRMADGSHRPIASVRVLDKVATAEGGAGVVTAVMARRYDGHLVRVIAWGHSHLRCTPEHPILTRRGFVPAKDLNGDDWIALPRYVPESPPAYLDSGEVVDTSTLRGITNGVVSFHGLYGVTQSVVSPLPEKIRLDYDFGRLVGLYAAEGSTSVTKVTWSFGKHEKDSLVSDTVRLVRRALGGEARVQERPNGLVNVVLYGKHWALLLGALVPGTAKRGDKQLSRYVTNAPQEFLQGVLDGWHQGDGHVRLRRGPAYQEGVTVSRRLATDMFALAIAFGRRPGVLRSEPVLNRYVAGRQAKWTITSQMKDDSSRVDDRPLDASVCRCGCGTRLTITRERRPAQYISGHNSGHVGIKAQQDGRYLWRRVRKVVEEPFDDTYVFNLEVEGDHSYIADSVGVHNCTGMGWTGEALASPIRVDFTRLATPGWPQVPLEFARTLYHWAQQNDEWPGVDYQGSSVLAAAKGMCAVGLIGGYTWCFTIADVIDSLLTLGPVVLGLPWLSGMMDAPNGELKVVGQQVGGHCILALGYHPARVWSDGSIEEGILLRNSWGAGWGVGGSAYIRAADLAALLGRDGEACVPQHRSYGRAKRALSKLAARLDARTLP